MYNPFKTAIKRNNLSKPMFILHNKGFLTGKVLDFACGYGEDVEILSRDHKVDIIGYDRYNEVHHNETLLSHVYDVITCNYMFNVVPDMETHRNTLFSLKNMTKELYIAVRSDKKAIRPNWEYDDACKGYWTTKGTFQRFYDEEMIMQMFGDVEYIINDGAMKLFKIRGN